jgi:ADP-ribosyl-[dinitrogen reductase] hydrolase
MSEAQIQIKHGTVNRMIGGGWLDLRPGQWTDETQLALVLGSSVFEKGEVDLDDVVERYLDWYRTGPVDLETMTRASLALLEDGVSREEASRQARLEHPEKSASHGTLARSVPLALWYGYDRSAMIRETLAEARITHDDRIPGSASVVLNLLIAEMIKGENDLSALLERVSEDLFETNDVEHVLPDPKGCSREQLRPGDAAVDTLEVALWFLYHTDSFQDCLVGAVNMGGESGAIGSVAGALAGGWYGLDSIPKGWLSSLQGRNRVDHLARCLSRGYPGTD